MKINRIIIFNILFSLTSSLYAQDVVLLKSFNINGHEEIKKVKIREKIEYDYSGREQKYSEGGNVKKLYFYNENGRLEKVLEAQWRKDSSLISIEYNLEKNITELKNADRYYETLYFYNQQNQLIKMIETPPVTDINPVVTYYSYDEKGQLIQMKDDRGTYNYEYNDEGSLIHEYSSLGGEEFYEYDDSGRKTYRKWIHNKKNIYEYFFNYEDGENTCRIRRTKKAGEETVFDFTDFEQYDEYHRLVYSKKYFHINTSEAKLLFFEIKESFIEYDDNGWIKHLKEVVDGNETNKYYEYVFWDNGKVNTCTTYEEVQ